MNERGKTEDGNQEKKRPERERKKERSESKLIKMTAEVWRGEKERDKFHFAAGDRYVWHAAPR